MSLKKYQKEQENALIDEFLQTFHEKMGYYPTVIINQKKNIDRSKTLTLAKIEEYFESYLPVIFDKKAGLSSIIRRRPLPELRFMFSYIARSMRYSLKQIGEHLGGRDHTTIIHGLNTFKDLYETDDKFKEIYYNIINKIKEDHEPSTMEYLTQMEFES
jgi:chromosomal replication initiator protein